MNKKLVYLFSILFLVVIVLAACGGETDDAASEEGNDDGTSEETEETVTLTLAENHPEDYPTTIGNEEFARLVEEKTDGRYEVEVYAGGQLGEESEVLEQVQLGTIELARVNSIPLTQFSDEIGVLSMPYLFDDEEAKWDKLNGEVGQELLGTLDGSGLVGLTFYDSGERSFYNSERPVETPEDMEGLQIRVQSSDLAIAIVESLGASATPMEYGEVYSAMQTGVIDGAENNFPSYYTSNHYEVAEYFTVNGYQGTPEVLLGSEDLWDDLSDEDREAFTEAAMESVDVQREAWAELTEESREAVIENGNELVEVEDTDEWREAVQPVYDEFGDQYSEWIDRLTE
ncbi:tripartite ATP-independent transporter DctP family solute receptor [Virgibacillus natechei]|uniref:Tripartite ATP-independent transporter DctP family solute receptor n=1 Tax=Virgibacillus natechei TaxID=1216297 RepID=A0ABS4IEY7_9BACI|nr:TRAP transporter substrate-binding protein [Virgibacillus natechei]MBP1968589.1 tripartite ATP-independent transporter DctP family solute receptor [Virgibacillus natechei]UZD13699.1 TRAP transporter substrate-binding protein [Virgibacillus natechei]